MSTSTHHVLLLYSPPSTQTQQPPYQVPGGHIPCSSHEPLKCSISFISAISAHRASFKALVRPQHALGYEGLDPRADLAHGAHLRARHVAVAARLAAPRPCPPRRTVMTLGMLQRHSSCSRCWPLSIRPPTTWLKVVTMWTIEGPVVASRAYEASRTGAAML